MKKLIVYRLEDNKKITIAEFNFYKKEDKELVRKKLDLLKIKYDGIDYVNYLGDKND